MCNDDYGQLSIKLDYRNHEVTPKKFLRENIKLNLKKVLTFT